MINVIMLFGLFVSCFSFNLDGMSNYRNQNNQYGYESDSDDESQFNQFIIVDDLPYCQNQVDKDADSDDEISDFFKKISITSQKELKLKNTIEERNFSGFALKLESQDHCDNSVETAIKTVLRAPLNSSVNNVSVRRKVTVQKKMPQYLITTVVPEQDLLSCLAVSIKSITPTSVTTGFSPANSCDSGIRVNKRKNEYVAEGEYQNYRVDNKNQSLGFEKMNQDKDILSNKQRCFA